MAAICGDCEQDMNVARSCNRMPISLDGQEWQRVRYGDGHIDVLAAANGIRCPDCGVMPGGVHHAGCCKETCPACGLQLFCCDCWKDDGDYEDGEEGIPFAQAFKKAQELSKRMRVGGTEEGS